MKNDSLISFTRIGTSFKGTGFVLPTYFQSLSGVTGTFFKLNIIQIKH